MKDKEKQVEEMAKVICISKIRPNCKTCEYNNGCISQVKAKEIYNKVVQQAKEQAIKEFAEIATEKIAKMQGERDCYEANSIDNKAKYDGDIVDLALHETLKEVIGDKNE